MAYRYRSIYILLIITMCAMEGVYTSTTGGNEPFSDWLNKTHVQDGPFLRTSCQWNPGDKSVMCESLHLRRVPSNFPHNAMTFHLSNNDISILLNTSFQPYPNLENLDLTRNQIRTIQSAAFQPLKHLKLLDLSTNYHLVIPSSDPFRPLETLITLNIGACNLKDLPNDLLENFPNLTSLYLGENRLSSLNVSKCKTAQLNDTSFNDNKFRDLSPDTFLFVCPTVTFNMMQNPISYISEDTIAALPVEALLLGRQLSPTASMLLNLTSGIARSNISRLFLSKLELRDGIPLGVFKPVYDHPFELLHIQNSGDLSLYKNVFVGLSCLEMRLNSNFIKEIEPEYFLGISRLQTLILWNNQIMDFNPHNTTWKCNMQHLDLSRNTIQQLHSYQFRGLSNLKKLNLTGNTKLVWLNFLSNDGLESLEILDATGTTISILALSSGLSQISFEDLLPAHDYPFAPGKTFNDTIKLTVIDLTNTKLTRRHLWDSYMSRSLFQGLIHLTALFLSNNPLGNLPDKVFEDNLLVFLLVSTLTANTFKGLESLTYLNLNGNALLQLSTDALHYMPVIETLSIDNNKLMVVEEGAIENNKFLRNLIMSNNQLVAFNRSTWNTIINNLDYIDVSGNPLACQCKYGWFHDRANLSQMLLHQNETLCSVDSLSQVKGKSVLEFDPSKYCVQNTILISTLPFVVLGLLIGLLVAFHNRWLIRYKLFLVKLAVIGYMEMQDAREHHEFIFDFNIMFSEENEGWARENLRLTLEERLPDYDRYSFGDEDLTLGMHYLEAVHYAVQHSFKTILLLSRSAVRDNWFLIKLRTAMDHVHDELTENTVVIFLEDIPEDEIPYLLRLYLSDRRPYMRWPKDIRGREYFWNELIKVATVNLRYNPLVPPE